MRVGQNSSGIFEPGNNKMFGIQEKQESNQRSVGGKKTDFWGCFRFWKKLRETNFDIFTVFSRVKNNFKNLKYKIGQRKMQTQIFPSKKMKNSTKIATIKKSFKK